MNTSTEMTIPLPADSSLGELITDRTALEAMLDSVEKAALSLAPDTSTAKGRDEIKSNAYKIAQSKTALDKAGLASTESLRAKVTQVNELRAVAKERLGALQATVRKPLTDWEEAEEKRKEELLARLAQFDKGRVDFGSTSEQIRAATAEIEAIEITDNWAEHKSQAEFLKREALDHFAALLPEAEKREAEAVELEELRALKAEQERKDAEAQAAERKAAQEREAAETYKRNVEAQALAAEQAAQAERDRAEQAAKEADERHARELEQAKADQKAAEQRHAQQIKDAAEAERKRIADEQAAAAAEEERKLANTRRANRIKAEIQVAIGAMKDQSPEAIAEAIYSNKIPHVKVTA